MTPDAQALAPVLAKLNCQNATEELHPEDYLNDAFAALEWVADNLRAEGDAGDALRGRLELMFVVEPLGKRRRLIDNGWGTT